jgi:hypothetical protein
MPRDENGVWREPTNEDRASWALDAVRAYCVKTRFDQDYSMLAARELLDPEVAVEIVGDLLCDLTHLVGSELMEECQRAGQGHFEADLIEEWGDS